MKKAMKVKRVGKKKLHVSFGWSVGPYSLECPVMTFTLPTELRDEVSFEFEAIKDAVESADGMAAKSMAGVEAAFKRVNRMIAAGLAAVEE